MAILPKLHLITGKPDASPAGKVRRRVRESARDWPACPHCGGRAYLVEHIGNVKNKICSACFMVERRRVTIE